MTRPKKKRSVKRPPLFTSFKPAGIRGVQLKTQGLTLDEIEAIRLADYMSMDHAESAEKMEISRSTFSRLVEKARNKVAQFLIEGKHLQIEGGEIHFRRNLIRCRSCGQMVHVAFDEDLSRCPNCGSPDLIDLADRFGHGNCCFRHQHRHGR